MTAKAKTRKQTAKAKSAGEGVKITIVERIEIEPLAVAKNPWQPRVEFDEAGIERMADTLRDGVQLQAILVRRASEGVCAFQLLCGERRLRAARLAGVMVRADVCECSDRAARLIALSENEDRRDLSPIEKATAYQMMLDNGDAKGPSELAKQYGLDPSTVSNLLRLLKLPETWQRRIISREITERHGRAVLRFESYPQILGTLEALLVEAISADGEAPSVAAWEKAFIPEVIRKHGRPTLGPMNNGSIYDQQHGMLTVFEPTEAQAEDLGVIDVAGTPHALNAELWDQLQAEHVEELLAERRKASEQTEQEETEGTDDSAALQEESPETAGADGTDDFDDDAGDEADEADSPDESDGGDLASPEPPEPDRRQASGKDFASRLWAWKTMFARRAVAEHLRTRASSAELLKVALLLMVHWDSYPAGAVDDHLIDALKSSGGRKRINDIVVETMQTVDCIMPPVAGAVLARGFWTESGPADGIDGVDVLMLAEFLGVDLSQEWTAGNVPEATGYWHLHTKEQLLAIAKEVKLANLTSFHGKLSADQLAQLTKQQLVVQFLGAMAEPDSKEAGIPMPKEIAKAKPARK